MSVQIKTPNIIGGTDREKLAQIQSYLYQMARQLQWAFDTIGPGTQSTGTTNANTGGKGKAAAADPLTIFAGLKGLIIKSADIVDAYYEEINRKLVGQYVAQSDFGTYSQETSQKIQENADGVNRAFTNIQEIESSVAEINDQLLAVNAYIKTGILYYGEDGLPIYGVEIGQQNAENGVVTFQKYARLTSGKLSFYDENDSEVAYISDYRLHITVADIKELTAGKAEIDRLQMGDYTWSVGADGHYSLA